MRVKKRRRPHANAAARTRAVASKREMAAKMDEEARATARKVREMAMAVG